MTTEPKIIIAGVGALGSHLVMLMRNLDAKIFVVDHDRVEQRNILSQFHSKTNIGKLKVDSIKQTMNFLFGKKIEMISSKLVENNVEQIINKSSLVVDTLDNAEGRLIIQRHVRKHNIPCLHGALAANGSFGRVVWDEVFEIDSEAKQGAATCEDGQHLAFISLTSSFLAQAAIRFLQDGKKQGYQIHPNGAFLV